MKKLVIFYFLLYVFCFAEIYTSKTGKKFFQTLFVEAPLVNYPTSIMADPAGKVVYISSDKNSSLSRGKNKGRVFKVVDKNLDGKADEVSIFIDDIDSPRGGFFVDNKLYLVHPPYLSSFEDTNGDGKADRQKVLVDGLGFDLNFRGADHTTNGARMGIDGWIYIAVGDYGLPSAKGADGTEVILHGGGLVRVRPDGSELEIVTRQLRNIYDVAISPYLDFFARDNTNDGLGWNTRFHHMLPLANAGYPRLYKNFPAETLLPIADFGGGSGTGMLYLHDPNWPKPYNDILLSSDFTTQAVYSHFLKPKGISFQINQEVFFKQGQRMIDLDIDGLGRLYIANWKNGKYRFSGENVGQVFRLVPQGFVAKKFPKIKRLGENGLVDLLFSASAVQRLSAQRELINRANKKSSFKKINSSLFSYLLKKIKDKSEEVYGRVAAIFSFKQIFGNKANASLGKLRKDSAIKAFVLRALADRKTFVKDVRKEWFLEGLNDANPRVKLESVNALVRLNVSDYNEKILHLAKGFFLPNLVRPSGIFYNKKLSFSVKSRAKKVYIPVKGKDKVYLKASLLKNSKFLFSWGEPKFINSRNKEILADKSLLISQEGNVMTKTEKGNALPIYHSSKAKSLKFGYGAKESHLLVFKVPEGAVTFEVWLAPYYTWSGDYQVDVNYGTNDPAKERDTENTPLAHVAIQSLGYLDKSVAVALKNLKNSSLQDASVMALFLAPHTKSTVDALEKYSKKLGIDYRTRVLLIQVLARLYYKEADWGLNSWWGTKPDDRGPYFKPILWSESDRIKNLIEKNFSLIVKIDLKKSLLSSLRLNRIDPKKMNIDISESELVALIEKGSLSEKDINKLLQLIEGDLSQLPQAYKALEKATKVSSSILFKARLKLLGFMKKENVENLEEKEREFIFGALHSDKEFLIELGKKLLFKPDNSTSLLWKHLINLSYSPLIDESQKEFFKNKITKLISSSADITPIIESILFIGADSYLPQLLIFKKSKNAKKYPNLDKAIRQLLSSKKRKSESLKELIGSSTTNDVMSWINSIKANPKSGKKYVFNLACIACHAFNSNQDPKGPYLGSVGSKFSKRYIIESILEPEKIISQGFSSKKITLKNGKGYLGFLVKKTEKFYEIRTVSGKVHRFPLKEVNFIEDVLGSQMPKNLASSLSRKEFADFIAYLESLKGH